MTVLVTGASGNVGREVAVALQARGQAVRALSRRPEQAGSFGIEVVAGDLSDRATLRPALDGVDSVFLLAGYPDVAGVLTDMAAAGVARVGLLSTGAVVGGNLDNAVVRFNVVSEAAVRDSGLEWTVLRPSGFMSNTLQWVSQLRGGDTVSEPFADVPVASIDPADIGAVAALVLTGDGHTARSYRLTGPEALLPADRARILSDVLGRDITLVAQSDDDARKAMGEAMPAPMVEAFFQFFRQGGYDDSQVEPKVPGLPQAPAVPVM